jgi:hypothetical protein
MKWQQSFIPHRQGARQGKSQLDVSTGTRKVLVMELDSAEHYA